MTATEQSLQNLIDARELIATAKRNLGECNQYWQKLDTLYGQLICITDDMRSDLELESLLETL